MSERKTWWCCSADFGEHTPDCKNYKLSASQPSDRPFAWAILEPGGNQYFGEHCIFGDAISARDQVETLNDEIPEDEPQYEIVPLYRVQPASQPSEPQGFSACFDATAKELADAKLKIAQLESELSLLRELVEKWKSEAKRCYDLARKRNAAKPEESVMAQSVRFWECACELAAALDRMTK